MLLETQRANKEAIESACRQFGARRIRVFGSVAYFAALQELTVESWYERHEDQD